MHTARIPPVDPAPATIAAVLAMHTGHIMSPLLANSLSSAHLPLHAEPVSRLKLIGAGRDDFFPSLRERVWLTFASGHQLA